MSIGMDVINLMEWRNLKEEVKMNNLDKKMEAQFIDSLPDAERLPAAPANPWRSITTGKLAAALSKAQGEIQNASKDKENPYFNSTYADLASVWGACRGPLAKNDLAVVQPLRIDGTGRMVLLTELIHSSGEWISSSVPVNPVKNDPQGVGSAITYMRRFALSALVGVAPAEKPTEDDVDDDDDGNAASQKKSPSTPPLGPKRLDLITGQQRKMLFAILPSCSTTEAQLRAYVKEKLNIDSIPNIPIRHFDNLIRAIKEGFVSKTQNPATPPVAFPDKQNPASLEAKVSKATSDLDEINARFRTKGQQDSIFQDDKYVK